MRKKTLIKCDKCGSTDIVDEIIEEVEVTVITMDDYIKKEHFKSSLSFPNLQFMSGTGTSHMTKRILRCRDCGFERAWDQVIYT